MLPALHGERVVFERDGRSLQNDLANEIRQTKALEDETTV